MQVAKAKNQKLKALDDDLLKRLKKRNRCNFN